MGGWGSGQHGTTACTDDCCHIDARRLARDGLLKPGSARRWHWTRDGERVASVDLRADALYLHLSYRRRAGEAWQDLAYAVALDWTRCHYGGERTWFRCPTFRCGRRVAMLYMGSHGLFACRHCYRLAYRCQRETAEDRATRRAERIRARLQWEPGILNEAGDKPAWMRWRTFDRLTAEHDALVSGSLAMLADRLGLVPGGRRKA